MASVNLKIEPAGKADVYRDVARIPEKHRIDKRGRPLKEGRVAEIKAVANGISLLLILRGNQESEDPVIWLDESTRKRLKVEVGQVEPFELKSVGIWGQWRWACSATEPAYRISAHLAMLSVFVGLVGFLLGILSICLSIYGPALGTLAGRLRGERLVSGARLGLQGEALFAAKVRCAEMGRQYFENQMKASRWAFNYVSYIYSPQLNTCLMISEYDSVVLHPITWHGQLIRDCLTGVTLLDNRMPILTAEWKAEHKAADEKFRSYNKALVELQTVIPEPDPRSGQQTNVP